MADLNFVYVVARILEFLSPEISRTSLVSSMCTYTSTWIFLLQHENSIFPSEVSVPKH